MNGQIDEIARLVDKAHSILFLTGAGLSADSGMPTYRGVGGLYADADTEEGFPIEVALSGPMFARSPEITWKYLWQIGAACAGAEPNAGHHAIARLEAERKNVWVLTQNVDGLHRRAGSTQLIEAHGHAFELLCTKCAARFEAAQRIADYRGRIELPPVCPECSGVLRPDVVLFGETLPQRVLAGLAQVQGIRFDLVFSVGTSALFGYISHFIYDARYKGIPCVEINPGETEVSEECSHRIRGGAAEALSAIVRGGAGGTGNS